LAATGNEHGGSGYGEKAAQIFQALAPDVDHENKPLPT
jgi:hypothetical protein